VYVSDRTGAPQIFIIGEDGSNDTQLTFEGRNEHPFWSPDGAQIYFLSDRGQGVALWSMRPDGSEQTELLKAPGSIGYAISPNNEHVTYLQVSQNGINLFLDGLLWAEIPGQHMTYQWSPNSQYVVLEQDYSKTIGLLSITSSTIIPLTDSAYASWNPTWSPDSNFVAFASTKDGNAGIYTVNIQSQEMRRLTPLNTWSQAPSWSTDGSLIAYITGENGNGGWSLFVSDPLGSNRRWLLAPVFPGAPGIWSHTGDKLAFLISDGDEEIAVIDRDGSGLQQLTSNNARDWDPAWEPR
jgi:Tol biopolymer transport system component